MAISRQKKVELVSSFTEMVQAAKSVVFVKFRGLTVNDANVLRKALTHNGVGLTVTKKTLLKRALEANKIEGELPALEGEVAIAYGTDLLAPAREVFTFQKLHKDALAIVGGVFEGKYMNASQMLAIATIPGREVLIGMFANVINSPIQRFAVALAEVAKKKGN